MSVAFMVHGHVHVGCIHGAWPSLCMASPRGTLPTSVGFLPALHPIIIHSGRVPGLMAELSGANTLRFRECTRVRKVAASGCIPSLPLAFLQICRASLTSPTSWTHANRNRARCPGDADGETFPSAEKVGFRGGGGAQERLQGCKVHMREEQEDALLRRLPPQALAQAHHVAKYPRVGRR